MTKTAKDILVDARGLIEKGWTQDAFARNADRHAVAVDEENATCFCSVGALRAAAGREENDDFPPEYFEAKYALNRILGYEQSIITFNDAPGRSKEEVLTLFDNAIARLNAEEEAR